MIFWRGRRVRSERRAEAQAMLAAVRAHGGAWAEQGRKPLNLAGFVEDYLAAFGPPRSEPRCAQPAVSRVTLGALAVLAAALALWWWA